MDTQNSLNELVQAVADLMEETVADLIKHSLADGIPGRQIIEAMSAGLDEVGRRYKEGTYFLSELVLSGEMFQQGMNQIKPFLNSVDYSTNDSGVVVVGTVKNDIHDLGKNIVVTLLEGAGFEVIDLGVDVPAEKFVDAVRESGAGLVGLSVLLTTAFDSMKDTVVAFEKAEMRERVKIMIGGGGTSDRNCEELGVDYYGRNATDAVDIARKIFA